MESLEIFQNVCSLAYFEKMQGFNEQISLEFAQALNEQGSLVRGVSIVITEEVIAKVMSFPFLERCWFCKKLTIPTTKATFLQQVE